MWFGEMLSTYFERKWISRKLSKESFAVLLSLGTSKPGGSCGFYRILKKTCNYFIYII